MSIVYYNPRCSNPVSFPLKQSKNNGITDSKGGMPQKFNGADGGSSFSAGRNLYIKTTLANESNNIIALTEAFRNKKKCTCAVNCNHISCECKVCNSRYYGCSVGKSINVQSSDQYIQRKKNQAIGKGSMPGQTKDGGSTKLSFKNPNFNTSRDALRKCRSGGCVAPAKKAAAPYCMK